MYIDDSHKHVGQPLAATMGATMPPSVDSHNHLGQHWEQRWAHPQATVGPPCEGAGSLVGSHATTTSASPWQTCWQPATTTWASQPQSSSGEFFEMLD